MRPIQVTVGPLAAASANNIATSQTAAGAGQILLNGTTAASAFSGTGTIAGNVLTVTAVTSGVLTPGMSLVASGANAGAAVTQYLTGTGGAGTYILNGSQATLGSRTILGNGVAVLDQPRRVLITSAGNDSGITFTVVGTTFGGAAVSETITGGNIAAVATQTDFATVTGVSASAATASTVTVGTNGVAGSAWARFDDWSIGGIFIQAIVNGTVNYTVQQTTDDPNSPTYPISIAAVNWMPTNDQSVVNATASAQSNYIVTPCYARVLLNSGSGVVTTTFIQTGVNPA